MTRTEKQAAMFRLLFGWLHEYSRDKPELAFAFGVKVAEFAQAAGLDFARTPDLLQTEHEPDPKTCLHVWMDFTDGIRCGVCRIPLADRN